MDQVLPFPDLDVAAPSRQRLISPMDPFEIQPTGRDDLPGARAWATALLVTLVEVLAGQRPVGQLARMTSPSVLSGIRRDAARLSRLGRPGVPAQLKSVHLCEPADGVAEVAAVVFSEGRARAIAVRLEGLDGSWRCVRLAIG
jgi:hypothetical protein